mmetsp:Transcript_120225/g.299911  ORF Transcript_120225/g.299911 Transcript_120225/m.299911 type:complete len:230 (-) Transcript_120225:277-966(-)
MEPRALNAACTHLPSKRWPVIVLLPRDSAQDSAATASACCISCAISNAVTPCTFLALLSQTGSNCFTTSALPLMAAHMSGVAPVLSTCDGSACAERSMRTTSAWPACAAYINAVFLSSSTTSLPKSCTPCLTFSTLPSETAFKKAETLSWPKRISQTSRFSTLPCVSSSEGMRNATQNSQEPVISRWLWLSKLAAMASRFMNACGSLDVAGSMGGRSPRRIWAIPLGWK